MSPQNKNYELWFATGSQHLYGPETLKKVAEHSLEITGYLNHFLPVKLVYKDVLKTSNEIRNFIQNANSSEVCIGIVAWMHTFSPGKMWINGLKISQKPLLHLHTQYNAEIPWNSIDMDFMNLNQSAHGGREFGFINTRMKINRKVVVGHWKDSKVVEKLSRWSRVALGWNELQTLKVARIGDNMREVAVTEGNQVSAQINFGCSVNGYGLGDLLKYIDSIGDPAINQLIAEYHERYLMDAQLRKEGEKFQSLVEAARIELGLRAFLEDGGFNAFTDTFENLFGLKQLPGIAVQRLMADGYGFGAEGDWKTAALVRTMKVMGEGLEGGNTFMEDYTYHFSNHGNFVLGSHMLEICPSVASGNIKCAVHPLGIGGKDDPVRLIFNGGKGNALNASLLDLGNRFRLLINEVKAEGIDQEMPNLPVASVLWNPMPNLDIAAHGWILAGGAHHTCYSENIKTQDLEDLAEIAGLETVIIDEQTDIRTLKQNLRNNEVYYGLRAM